MSRTPGSRHDGCRFEHQGPVIGFLVSSVTRIIEACIIITSRCGHDRPQGHGIVPVTRIAFLGDINGGPGRRALKQMLPRLKAEYSPDYVVINGENARNGSGLTPAIMKEFLEAGVDGVTLGDHAYRDQRILTHLEQADQPVARPANLSSNAIGKSCLRLRSTEQNHPELHVMTVLGRVYLPFPANDPFECVDRYLEQVGSLGGIILIEAHMEATSEKIALAHHLDGRVAAVVGTHTHVPTADARILPSGTAFITDVGMCGPYDSVIGRNKEAVLKHMTTSLHVPYDMAEGDVRLCGAVIDVDDSTLLSTSITRIEYSMDPD